ncbi:ABC transporter ATP-binding protein [Nitrospira sp. BLG_2]|uniref:ABC transporter ATP-binding protein n=1 Tax=Nitrospira sp. BLG_2 TaxID=3397507 RepID=UPI003B9BE44F
MRRLIKRLHALLNRKERRLSYALLGLMVLAGLIDALGVSSILPFMAVVGNPELIQTNPWLHHIFTWLEFESTNTFLVGLGSAAIVILVFSNAVSLVSSSAILWFAYNLEHSLSTQILSNYARQPYAYFLEQNSSNLVLNCTGDVARVTNGIAVPVLQAIAKAIIAMSILLLVMWVDPWLALLVGTVIGTVYTGVYLNVRQKMTHLGRASKEAQKERFRLATEVLNGIKELKILGQDDAYQDRFAKYAALYAKNQWMSATVSQVPRYAIESIAFGSVILLVIYLLATHQDFKEALPLMALYAFTAYRLLPAFQQLFGSATAVRFNMGSLEAVEEKLKTLVGPPDSETKPIVVAKPTLPVNENVDFLRQEVGPLQQEIVLENLVFQYSNAPVPLINNLNLTIQRNTTVAIVGSSGGGKTTIVDIILGLLEPQDGTLLVDGIPITSCNVTSWQKHLGYVPQHIYVADDTLAANIAFGVAPRDLDIDRVEHAARIANLHEFVMEELPNGYETMVGERGVRLSGGQRQRIGIARAVYSDPDVLILDEATSALDSLTEDAVTEAIRNVMHEKTIIMIAHRLSTVQQADIIYLLENGSISDQGTYEELLDTNGVFRRMAKEGV